jgi:hypothetical protein
MRLRRFCRNGAWIRVRAGAHDYAQKPRRNSETAALGQGGFELASTCRLFFSELANDYGGENSVAGERRSCRGLTCNSCTSFGPLENYNNPHLVGFICATSGENCIQMAVEPQKRENFAEIIAFLE